MKALLPCPFCGASQEPEFSLDGEVLSYVVCMSSDCDAMGPTAKTDEDAIEAWNRRPAPVEMEADTRRLDWLEEHQPDVLWAMASEPFMVYLDDPGPESARPTLRECIDAAINQQSNEVSE